MARKRRAKRKGGPCKTEFDYSGWAAWGEWQRGLSRNTKEPEGREKGLKEDKGALFILKEHDCLRHCDYPSECKHEYYRAFTEGRIQLSHSPVVENIETATDGPGVELENEKPVSMAVSLSKTTISPNPGMNCPTSVSVNTMFDRTPSRKAPSSPRSPEQERRSQRKLAQLTGEQSFLPINEVQSGGRLGKQSISYVNLSGFAPEELGGDQYKSFLGALDEGGDLSSSPMAPKLDLHEYLAEDQKMAPIEFESLCW
jgi:hypothetical protein